MFGMQLPLNPVFQTFFSQQVADHRALINRPCFTAEKQPHFPLFSSPGKVKHSNVHVVSWPIDHSMKNAFQFPPISPNMNRFHVERSYVFCRPSLPF